MAGVTTPLASLFSPAPRPRQPTTPARPPPPPAQGAGQGGTLTSATSRPIDFSITSPHHAPIDLTTKEGQSLFRKASREDIEETDRIKCTLSEANHVVDHFEDQVRRFCFTQAVHHVPTAWALPASNTPGATRRVAPLTTGSILTSKTVARPDVMLQSALVFTRKTPELPGSMAEIEAIKANAINSTVPKHIVALDDPSSAGQLRQYQSRMKLDMLGKNILNSVDSSTAARLRLCRKDFEWIDLTTGNVQLDGGLVLWQLLDFIQPSTRIRSLQWQQKVETARLDSFDYNVVDLVTHLEEQRDLAAREGVVINNWTLNVFNAILGPPAKPIENLPEMVRLQLAQMRSNWELSLPGNEGDDAMRTLLVMYNNLTGQTTKDGNVWLDTIKGKNNKIMALASQVSDLKSKLKNATINGGSNSGGSSGGGSSGGGSKSKNTSGDSKKNSSTSGGSTFPAWRTKYSGAKKTVDGTEYVWCKHHTGRDNEYSGMYMNASTHPTHEAWAERKANFRRGKKDKSSSNDSGGGTSTTNTGNSTTGKQLKVSQSLKTAMMAKGFSSDQAKAVLEEMAHQSGN